MTKTLIKASAIACVLGGFAFAGPAFAVSLVPMNGTDRIVTTVADEEVDAVEEDLRPDVKAPGTDAEGAPPPGETEGQDVDEGDIGEKEVEKDMGDPEE